MGRATMPTSALRFFTPSRLLSRDPSQIDSRTRVVTPENVAFEYRTAGAFARLGAYMVDVLVQIGILVLTWIAIVLFVMLMFAGSGGGAGQFLAELGMFGVLVVW